jgi:hypothetical protein
MCSGSLGQDPRKMTFELFIRIGIVLCSLHLLVRIVKGLYD